MAPVFPEAVSLPTLSSANTLLLTGIASPRQMELDLKDRCRSITPMSFGDHHQFTAEDVERINSTFAAMPKPKIIVTTEKDATRLEHVEGLSKETKSNIYGFSTRNSIGFRSFGHFW